MRREPTVIPGSGGRWRGAMAALAAAAMLASSGARPLRAQEARGSGAAGPPSEMVRTQRARERARQAVRLCDYRTAERVLGERIGELERAGTRGAYVERLRLERARVYLASGRYGDALAPLESASRALLAAEPTPRVLRELTATTLLAAEAHAGLGRQPGAIAAVRASLARLLAVESDAADRLALLARLATLEPAPPAGDRRALDDAVAAATRQLEDGFNRGNLAPDDLLRGVRDQAEYLAARGQYAQAVAALQTLCESKPKRRPPLSPRQERSAWLALADVQRRAGQPARELESLDRAARLSVPAAGALDAAEIDCLAGAALLRDGRASEAGDRWRRALGEYERALMIESGDLPAPVMVLARLADLRERLLAVPGGGNAVSLRDAVAAVERLGKLYQQQLLPGDARLAAQQTTLGALYLSEARSADAAGQLEQARQAWRARLPAEPMMLARTLNLLAEALLDGGGTYGDIEGHLREADRLCQADETATELRHWIRLNQARLETAFGHYAAAKQKFAALEAELAGRHDALRSLMLLYQSVLEKQLLRFEEARRLCELSLQIRRQQRGEDDAALVPHYTALAGLHVALRDPQSLEKVVQAAEPLCRGLPAGDERALELGYARAMVEVLNYEQALRGDAAPDPAAHERCLAALERVGREAEVLPRGQSSLAARTRYQQARVAYLQWCGQYKVLMARRAQSLRDADAQLAALSKERNELADAWKAYEGDVQRYDGDVADYERSADRAAQQRQASFENLQRRHTQLERELGRLNQWEGELNARAEQIADGLRERLEQSTQLRADLRRATHEALAAGSASSQAALDLLGDGRFRNLRYAVLCNDAQIVRAQAESVEPGTRGELLERSCRRLDEAVALAEAARRHRSEQVQERAEFFVAYQTAFDLLVHYRVESGQVAEALAAAERGRSLTLLEQLDDVAGAEADLDARAQAARQAGDVVTRFLATGRPLLYYYVGAQRSYAIFGSGDALRAITLRDESATLLTAAQVEHHVGQVRAYLADPSPDAGQQAEAARGSAALLPRAAADFLRAQRAREFLTVVPHGVLARLPLEALVLESRPGEPRFVDDVCPPLAYVPSLAILARLEAGGREAATPSAARLVTLGNPTPGSELATAPADSLAQASTRPYTAKRLPTPLPFAEQESRRILQAFRGRFAADRATQLVLDSATEANLRGALAAADSSPTIVHIAAHGYSGDSDGNQAAWIQLAPPAAGAGASDDGSLSLAEIYQLPLAGCQLAVLSACDSNVSELAARVGGSATIDPCFSLAAAFLAAGSNRVVATQWRVEDESSSALVSAFLQGVLDELADGKPVHYAAQLAAARRAVRADSQHPAWRSPLYWAPFVLVGRGDGAPLVDAAR